MSVSSDSSEGAFQGEWRAFMMEPAVYVDSAYLHACFGDSLSAEFCDRLRTSPRLQDRLSTLIREHYGLEWTAAETCGEIDQAVALSSAERLAELALHSGAIYWSAAIANTVIAQDVEALGKELGDELCAFAMSHRDLAGPVRILESHDTLRSRIVEDGWRCLGAWRHLQPEGIAVRVRLKLSPTPAFDDHPLHPFDALGPSIVRRAASANRQE
jgi:hypothetical protein